MQCRICLVSFAIFMGIVGTANGVSSSDDSCVAFLKPRRGMLLTEPSCTIAVDVCPEVQAVGFTARFGLEGQDTVIFLGKITRPPFGLIWSLKDIPYQLYEGVTIDAEASLRSGKRIRHNMSELFFLHKRIDISDMSIPYVTASMKSASISEFSLVRSSNWTAMGGLFWNESGIHVVLRAKNSLFNSALSPEKKTNFSVEILVTGHQHLQPYPSRNVAAFLIPVFGRPSRIVFQTGLDDKGRFTVQRDTIPTTAFCDVDYEDFKGFSMECTLADTLFESGHIPSKLRGNIILHVSGTGNSPQTFSLAQARHNAVYSPLTWPVFMIQKKPFVLRFRLLLGALVFAGGFLLGIVLISLMGGIRTSRDSVGKFEQTEEEKNIMESIHRVVGTSYQSPRFSIEALSKELRIPEKRIHSVIRKYTGKTFTHFLMESRIEVVKERLRSSNARESAIAAMCGFEDTREMEKYFRKFCHTTPYRFRKEYSVT